MALTSMKRDADEAYEVCYDSSKYGWGLQISLDSDQVEKLGITKAMRAGQQVSVRALAVVVSVTESLESDGDSTGPDISLCLQITDLDLTPQGTANAAKAASMLYGDGE
ncbi:capsid staple protein [Cupriavidus sp. CuC1]|uniref:capsid staple protein n=1 Tax=Cupriavidus sp. CuC1 TaxID=3373131 RepID=UPI0037D3F3A6